MMDTGCVTLVDTTRNELRERIEAATKGLTEATTK